MIVTCPKWWIRADTVACAKLINVETDTGWKITLIMYGDVDIVDPEIEKRDMCDFLPLLLSGASVEDIEKINAFMESRPEPTDSVTPR